MGIGPGSRISSCGCDMQSVYNTAAQRTKEAIKKTTKAFKDKLKSGNPNPRKFFIKDKRCVGKYTILTVNYPDCRNYEGDKILVMKYFDDPDGKVDYLDPHFCDGEHQSPIARFKPNGEGMAHALIYVDALVSAGL